MATKKRAAKAEKTTTPKKAPARKRRVKAAPASRGLEATALAAEDPPENVGELMENIATDGGVALAAYRDPLGGHWTVLAALPIERVEPTEFQRDPSDAHVKRLFDVIGQLDRFLDPVIAVRSAEGKYLSPNGNHRLQAMTRLGAKSIVALVVPEPEIAYKILALNTEKAHNLREKSLEVIRMARSLSELDPRPEAEFATEFEEPAFLTLGLAYEQRGRFSGGAYHPVLKRAESFHPEPLPEALELRKTRAEQLLAVDDAVVAAVAKLKDRGFTSPYLKAFVVARINPLRFRKGEPPPIDEVLEKMLKSATSFDASKVSQDQVATASGPSEET